MIRFLKRLLGFSGESRNPEGTLPTAVGDREPLTRFLFSDKLFARTAGRVKRHAFDPPVNLQLSVFRIHDVAEDRIWQLGYERAGANRNE